MSVGIHEVVYDKLYEILAAGAAEITDRDYQFDVNKSSFRMQSMKKDAAVFIRQEGMRQTTEGSATMRHLEFEAVYIIDCIATARGRKAGETYEQAQDRAEARVRHLVHQAISILWAEQELTLPVGTTGGLKRPTVSFFDLDGVQSERPIAGARVDVRVGIPFEPAGVDGTALGLIGVTLATPPEWAAEITPD